MQEKLWIILVWIISALCYLPLYFEQLGYAVPNALLQMKFLFVIVPILFALVFVSRKTSIKKWIKGLFAQKVYMEPLILCGIIASCGIFCTSILEKKAWDGVALLFNTLYLFCMATLEEIAWRGFRLESILQKKTERIAIMTVSFEWTVWHIPMWMIRNAIGISEIAFWLMYTILVGNIIGKCMMRYKNILVPIILHTIFNVCFLMSIKAGVIVVLCIWIGVRTYITFKLRRKTS